jgi:hypothetical protein
MLSGLLLLGGMLLASDYDKRTVDALKNISGKIG